MAAPLTKMRAMARRYMDQHLFETASYWADKAVSLSDGEASDVFFLAQTYIRTNQHQRAIHHLVKAELVQTNLCCRYMAAVCHVESSAWTEALELLGSDEKELREILGFIPQQHDFQPFENVEAAICCLRGRIHEHLDNSAKAIESYTAALLHDVYCIEAFERISEHSLLSESDETQLLQSLPLQSLPAEERDTLQFLYHSKLKKYTQLEEKIQTSCPKNLLQNNDVQVEDARRLYLQCNFQACFRITNTILDDDPFQHNCLPLHIACQVELKDVNGLFYLAHKLVDAHPKLSMSWVAVGSYYLSIRQFDEARKYFSKATKLDASFGPSWIGFGHSFAAEGEHDQAMAAYCTAARLLPGSHLPLLYIGMEYSLTNNRNMALRYLKQALNLCASDPLVWHEMGIVSFQRKEYEQAINLFKKALKIGQDTQTLHQPRWQATIANLARCFMCTGNLQNALSWYQKAIALDPKSHECIAGLGYVYHKMGDLTRAVECYHKALAIQSKHIFSKAMLDLAISAQVEEFDF